MGHSLKNKKGNTFTNTFQNFLKEFISWAKKIRLPK